MTTSPELMDYTETANRLGIKLGTLYAWVSQGRIPYIRLSGKLVRFDPASIERWLKEREEIPPV